MAYLPDTSLIDFNDHSLVRPCTERMEAGEGVFSSAKPAIGHSSLKVHVMHVLLGLYLV